jgi:hypothetical protein
VEIYCKRTLFVKDEKYVLCVKGKIYNSQPPTEFELESGLCLWVENELEPSGNQIGAPDNWTPLTLKTYEKYFTTIDEMRNNKINSILK